MTAVPVKCRCGALEGQIETTAKDPGSRTVCYCDDCQAFAHFLQAAEAILDENGGTDIFQITPAHLTITSGSDQIACVKLHPKGLTRWYAACCNTPLGNTLPTPSVPFVGIPTACLAANSTNSSLEDLIGPVTARIHGRFAKGNADHLNAHDKAPPSMLFAIAGKLLMRRLRGDHKPHPFFDAETGHPIVEPKVLTAEERSALR